MSYVEEVRQRPGMYFGGTDQRGMHALLWELVGNSLDQYLAGKLTRIDVTVTSHGTVIVDDDGTGISIDVLDGRTEIACLSPGLETSLRVDRQSFGPSPTLAPLVEFIASGEPDHIDVIICRAEEGLMKAEVGLKWCEPPRWEPQSRIDTYCNLLATDAGGLHLKGFQRGLADSLASSPSEKRAWRKRFDRLSKGLFAVVSVSLIDPEYSGPTKRRLQTKLAQDLVYRAVTTELPAELRRLGLRKRLKRRLAKA